MVSIGSKALSSRHYVSGNKVEEIVMGGDDKSYLKNSRKKGLSRKAKKGSMGFDADNSNKNAWGRGTDGPMKGRKSWKDHSPSEPQTSIVRKQVDPELAKYFSEIANLLESNEMDFEERSVLCRNALEETRGKEFEITTDYIISHTMQTLLEGCDVDILCGFLRGCAKVFPDIAMDRSGSHVAETALKSLAMHLQDEQAYSVIEETLTVLCKVMVGNPVDVMCNCHGSHVLRSLLCLCKGVPLDSSEFHRAKPSAVLAQRLNLDSSRSDKDGSRQTHPGFSDLLKFLVLGLLKCAHNDIETLQTDQFSSLVLQTALKLLVGHDEQLLQIIPILLGCKREYASEGSFVERTIAGNVKELMKETAFSHLMEVILEVAPESMYNEIFTKVFRNSLFELSSNQCANFVVQALVSHTRDENQIGLIWEELGAKFRELLEQGRPGVIAALIAASQRLSTHEHKCSQALAAAVCSMDESPKCIVPRILFLDSYFGSADRSNWNWPIGVRMHVIGSLILQAVLKFKSEFIQPYISSITSMESEHVFEVAKDFAGARVIEAFLGSNASGKQKNRLVVKLRGHFGELSVHPSGSFTVERCFTASNLSLREAIATELLAVRSELPKTKQGPHLLRRLDIDGFAARPEQWRLRQQSKQSTYKEFCSTFGSGENKPFKKDSFLADSSKQTSNPNAIKNMRKEIDDRLASVPSSTHKSGSKRHQESLEQQSEKYARHGSNDDISDGKNKKSKERRKNQVDSKNGNASSKEEKSTARPFLSEEATKKRHRKDKASKSSKKLKA